MIESMCVACHGPLPLKQRRTAAVCSENCHGMWRRVKRTGLLSAKYVQMRALHAYRRELVLTLEAVEGKFTRRMSLLGIDVTA